MPVARAIGPPCGGARCDIYTVDRNGSARTPSVKAGRHREFKRVASQVDREHETVLDATDAQDDRYRATSLLFDLPTGSTTTRRSARSHRSRYS